MPVFDMSQKELEVYQGSSPMPVDFHLYWETALKELEQTGLSYQLEKASFQAKGVECYDLWFQGTGGANIHAKFLKPAEIKEPIPGIAVFHGYMHHAGEWFERLPYVYTNKAVIVMEVRGQGGLSQDNSHAEGPSLFGHIVRGAADPDPHKLFYRNVYLDAVKTIHILQSMEFIDEKRIGATGKSQGGALALVSAALCPQVKAAAILYPFLSDFKRIVELDLNKGAYEGLYYYFKKYDPLHIKEADFYNRLGYIDIQNFAALVKAEVLWQTGLMDHTCPPSTQFAAYNKLKGKKEMKLYPEHDHELITYANDFIFQFFEKL